MQMIVNISLSVIFICMLFVILYRKIDVHPTAKGVMCVTQISIIGIWAQESHNYLELFNSGFVSTIAMLVVYVTYKAFKRGNL